MKQALQAFKHLQGHLVLLSAILVRGINLCLQLSLTKLIPESEYGTVVYAQNITAFIGTFLGFGIFSGLLHFAGKEKGYSAKQELFRSVFSKGILITILLVILACLLIPIIGARVQDSFWYLISAIPFLIGLALFEAGKVYARMFMLNKIFAYSEIYFALLNLTLSLIGTLLFEGIGFLIGTCIAILSTGIFLIHNLKLWKFFNFKSKSVPKSIWQYGLMISISLSASQLVYLIDNILIGNLIEHAENIAIYKVASLIPFSLGFLPLAIVNTSLMKVSNNKTNVKALKKEQRHYFTLTIPIVVFILLFGYFILPLGFNFLSELYQKSIPLLKILLLGLPAIFFLRVPFGNWLSVIGKAKFNTYIALSMLVVNVTLNYSLIVQYGIKGAAIATVIVLWTSGIASFVVYQLYLAQLTK